MTAVRTSPEGAELAVDDHCLWLPAGLDPDRTYDVLINGRHNWSVQPVRDGRSRATMDANALRAAADGRGWPYPHGPVARPSAGESDQLGVIWPKAFLPYLRGRAEVVLREHVSQSEVARATHVFAGSRDAEVAIVDRNEHTLVLDKWGRLIRPLSSDADDLVRDLVEQVATLLETIRQAIGLPAFICYGTLLGAVRNGEFIGHDNDVDIAYTCETTHPADITLEGFRVERGLRDAGYVVRRGSSVRLNVHLHLADGSIRFVDVFAAAWVEGLLYIPSDTGFAVPQDMVLPLSSVTLHGRDLPAPARPEALLELTYGPNWRVPDPSFKYETPRWLRRRFTGWWGGIVTGRKHWDTFSSQAETVVPREPTPFARWVQQEYPSDRPIVDLGAGTGRDTVFFATECDRKVTAVDFAAGPLRRRLDSLGPGSGVNLRVINFNDTRADLVFGARLAHRDEPVDMYARFLLHTLTPPVREYIYRLASMALRRGGLFFCEFRTPLDHGMQKRFKGVRYYLGPEEARERMEAHGGTVLYQQEGMGLAPFEDEDPYVCRMVVSFTRASTAGD